MSEQLEIGDALKQAREAKGWTLQDAANKLRLMVRQVEAMETEDYASLGQPVFARGFVRNYARLVGLDPEPLLARMEASGAAPAEKTEAEPYSPEESSVLSPLLIVVLIGVLLLLAIPTGLYWWLNSGEDEAPQAPAVAESAPVVAPVEPAVPAVAAGAAAPAEAAPAEATEKTEAPAPVMPSQQAATPGSVATPPPAAPVAAAAPRPAPAPAPVEKPAAVAAPEAEPRRPVLVPMTPPVAELPGAPENPYLPPNFRHKSIGLQFDDDAWVQIRDGSGRTIHSMLNKAGSTVELSGRPPFEFVIGNAAEVRMTYNGRAFDLKPYIGQTVARFTLE